MAVAMETPDTEVPAKARRRRFTAEYKQRILREAERCRKPGEIGALLRRGGLDSSHPGARAERGGRRGGGRGRGPCRAPGPRQPVQRSAYRGRASTEVAGRRSPGG